MLNLFFRLKLHEDWGTTPAAIDCALTAAEKHDVQVRLSFPDLFYFMHLMPYKIHVEKTNLWEKRLGCSKVLSWTQALPGACKAS